MLQLTWVPQYCSGVHAVAGTQGDTQEVPSTVQYLLSGQSPSYRPHAIMPPQPSSSCRVVQWDNTARGMVGVLQPNWVCCVRHLFGLALACVRLQPGWVEYRPTKKVTMTEPESMHATCMHKCANLERTGKLSSGNHNARPLPCGDQHFPSFNLRLQVTYMQHKTQQALPPNTTGHLERPSADVSWLASSHWWPTSALHQHSAPISWTWIEPQQCSADACSSCSSQNIQIKGPHPSADLPGRAFGLGLAVEGRRDADVILIADLANGAVAPVVGGSAGEEALACGRAHGVGRDGECACVDTDTASLLAQGCLVSAG